MGTCRGHLTTLHGLIWAHIVLTINLTFVGFNAIELLQSENTFVWNKALRYHKHFSMSLIAVGDVIIWKSIDTLEGIRDVKVSRSDDVMDHRPNGAVGQALAMSCS